ncbi:hypothetical protein SAMN05878426_101833 [Phaeovulum vinaykumarii]|uniref:Uncharacterized protein n=1 Tax=Phaeovulum vinaykumarii TaxID=407234 RepID=A0A1N7KD67_9RHOB|nr:hypothetical protein SAMN05421795_101837 [Phaeovulum vinaykumarii]SOB94138.1 hypothetical protein SAMN05878426_101833 [Phaeovulum vinaykumarii]
MRPARLALPRLSGARLPRSLSCLPLPCLSRSRLALSRGCGAGLALSGRPAGTLPDPGALARRRLSRSTLSDTLSLSRPLSGRLPLTGPAARGRSRGARGGCGGSVLGRRSGRRLGGLGRLRFLFGHGANLLV